MMYYVFFFQVSSPNVVTPVEAICTVAQFPLLMLHAFIQDVGWNNWWRNQQFLKCCFWKPASDVPLPIFNTAQDGDSINPLGSDTW